MKLTFEKSMQVASVVLIPISIAFAGHFFGKKIKEAELESQDKKFAAEHSMQLAKQDAEWKITRGELVFKFMNALKSQDQIERKIALEAIMIALPEDGIRIAQIVAESDPSSEVKETAIKNIDKEIIGVINDMFSDNKRIRIKRFTNAISNWVGHSRFLDALLKRSLTDFENEDAVFNVVLFLGYNDINFVEEFSSVVITLKDRLALATNREKTLDKLQQVINNMDPQFIFPVPPVPIPSGIEQR